MHTKPTLKTMMLPISMIGGALFNQWIGYLTFLSPYLIFMMLTITYCKMEPSDIRPHRFEGKLLVVQLVMAAVTYFSLFKWNSTIAGGVFICVYIPTATAAPVITSMLGGSLPKVTTYSLLINLIVAMSGPAVLAAIGEHADMTFWSSLWLICSRVVPLLLLPMGVAFFLRRYFRSTHDYIARHQKVSFYIWAVSLFITVGSSVSFAIRNWRPDLTMTMVWLGVGALIVCVAQFAIGRKVGAQYGDAVSGGQSLGQKNTLLAVWISLTYLDPVASIAPACYVAWQNIINSWQLMKYEERRQMEEPLINRID